MARADALAALGFRVFPVAAGKKAPPYWRDWPNRSSTTITPAEWPDGNPVGAHNVGIHCAGLLVVDVDPRSGGDSSFQLLEMTHGFPETYTVNTPSGGKHLYYRLPDGHEGIPNSVGRVGKGIDLRGNNGYVLGAGSHTADGRYEAVSQDTAVAPAPQWLIDAAGQPRVRAAPGDVLSPHASLDREPVRDAPDALVERAEAWLKTAPRSVKGDGGDQTAYEVACALRDFGVSYSQACDLMRSDAWDDGCGWRLGRLEEKPIASAYRYAQNAPGGRAAQDDDFSTPEILRSETSPNLNKDRGNATRRVLRLDEFAKRQDKGPGELVKGILQKASYAALIGQPGAGKSFLMFDLGYCVASDQPWMGRRVKGGPVAYLPFEGLGGLVKRAQALRQKYGEGEVPFYILPAAGLNLRDPAGRRALGALVGEMPTPPALIVVDTFAKAMAGGDENSAQDVGAFNLAVEALIDATGACVVAIHHSGKDKSKGARGSSALLGALDTELEVAAGLLSSTKQRDIEPGEPIGFRLDTVIVGMDPEEGEITSCVVQQADVHSPRGLPRLTGNAKNGFDILCQMAPDNQPIDMVEWDRKCRAEFLGTRKASFFEMKKILIEKGYVTMSEQGLVSRRMA